MKFQNFACSQCCRNTKRHQFKFEWLFIKNHLFSVSAALEGAVTATKEIGTNLILVTAALCKSPPECTHPEKLLKNTLLVFNPRGFFFHLEHPSLLFLPKLQWNSKTRRMGQETDGGKTCWNFLLLSDLQGFSAAITQKCYQMLLAIVGPKKNSVSAQSQPIFQDWEKEMLPSQMLSFASVYANSVLKFHNVSSFFLFCRIAQSRSLTRCTDQQENLDSEEGKLQLRGYLPTAAAFGFCHLILSLSLGSKLSAISWRETHFDECTCTVALHTRFCVWLYTLSIACRYRKVSFPSRHSV